jgi:SAM-dependent methyltransferase
LSGEGLNVTAKASNAYDALRYPSRCCPQAHPDRLATLATLFGMTPAPVERCRFLELGSGDAGNLLAMAFGLPGATFVGVDLAPGAVARGQAEARALKLANVELHCADLLDWAPPGGPFDYVIAHGLFSWVPEAVRRRTLEVCRDHLAPHGVAYVSYNALPGCHVRAVLRDMMRFHTCGSATLAEAVSGAKDMLRLFVAAQVRPDEQSAMLRKEAERILERDADPFLFHDDLAEVNRAYYFHEFMAMANQHRLQFVAEAELSAMQDSAYPPPVATALKRHCGGVTLKEQYLDFLNCRRFRQTLLCREGVALNHEPAPGLLRRFLIASRCKPKSGSPSLAAGTFEGFTGPQGLAVQVDDPLTKAALLELVSAWPRALPFDALVEAARARAGGLAGDADRLAADLLTACWAAVAELHVHQPAWEVRPGARPTLGPLARLQLAAGRVAVTSLQHTDVRVSEPALRELLLLLDGSRDVPAVVAEFERRIDAGELVLSAGTAREGLRAQVEQSVRHAVAEALLISWDESGPP